MSYIVTWQGRAMRQAPLSTLLKGEHGRLFTAGTKATVWKTHREATRAMRRSIKAWSIDSKIGMNAIAEARQWQVLRLAAPPKE